MKNKPIAIGCDHAGFPYKEAIITELESRKLEYQDFGTQTIDSVDYPDFVHPVASGVNAGKYDLGVLICGSGNGVAMTANKYEAVRAALCWSEKLASLARQHNKANVLCIPARFTSQQQAVNFLKIFLDTEFEGGRHQRRIDKIPLHC